jgi:23S rRNA (cytidine1920-2'-O)/16S rRNA (cytidine1409-2'-O)-methyltransferase
MAKEIRIDQLLVERGLAESRSQAQRLVMAGQVRVDGQVVPKSSSKFPPHAAVAVDAGPRFVSRGGEKLQAAFEAFELDVSGKVCADVGASTGGFTDCLLQHGASKVYAIDVGKGILHWKLRNDSRVRIMEETNVRYLKQLPEAVSFVVIDVSFISLKVILPVVRGWFGEADLAGTGSGEVLALIKPQFEAGRKAAGRGKGVIRDPEIHRQVLTDVLSFARESGFGILGLTRSPVSGPKGNVEFLAWLTYPETSENNGMTMEVLVSEVGYKK